MLASIPDRKNEPEFTENSLAPKNPMPWNIGRTIPLCSNLEEVLRELDAIINSSIRDKNYLGIFAYVYRRTTIQIKEGIEKQLFDNNDRMELFDVTFANRYIKAYKEYIHNRMVSRCWQSAFDARREELTIIQHIILGMNAHINFDLGLAAAEVMAGKPIGELEKDFTQVNAILADLVDELQTKLGKVSRLMFLLDWAGARNDEKIIGFSMEKARAQSWRTATEVWSLSGKGQLDKIRETDTMVTYIAERIIRPKTVITKTILRIIRAFEEKDIQKIIKGLQS
jgi:hypothetical protein